jgi:hypothetical protein
MFEINRAPWPHGGSHAHLDLASAAARALPPSLPACLDSAEQLARHQSRVISTSMWMYRRGRRLNGRWVVFRDLLPLLRVYHHVRIRLGALARWRR